MMKKPFVLAVLVSLLISCNMNPNKEERIQKLETEMQTTLKKVSELEDRVKVLETTNQRLELRINELEQ